METNRKNNLQYLSYLDICKLLPFWNNVEFDSLVVSGQSYASHQQDDQQNIRECGSEIHNLSETLKFTIY